MVAGLPASVVPDPPNPFDADTETLQVGDLLYRVGSNTRRIDVFNPGMGSPTRFAFFGRPVVSVLYGADTEDAAVCETLLHDIPASGGLLTADDYRDRVMGRIRITKPLKLARLRGTGLRRLKVESSQLTETAASEYDKTVAWAAAAHKAGFDGLSWTSRRCNDARAVALFGDEHRRRTSIEQDITFGRVFASGDGLDWLIDMCAPLHVDVMPPN